MADDFGTLVSDMLTQSQKPSNTTDVKKSIVTALHHYRGFKTWFTEKGPTNITLTAGTDNYSLPADFISADTVQWSNAAGTDKDLLKRITFEEFLYLQEGATVSGRPRLWALHHEKLFLYPTPSVTNELVVLHYHFDSTRNAADGALITTASGNTATNDWFEMEKGEPALRCYALYDLFMTRFHDPEKAAYFRTRCAEAEADILKRSAKWRKPLLVRACW